MGIINRGNVFMIVYQILRFGIIFGLGLYSLQLYNTVTEGPI